MIGLAPAQLDFNIEAFFSLGDDLDGNDRKPGCAKRCGNLNGEDDGPSNAKLRVLPRGIADAVGRAGPTIHSVYPEQSHLRQARASPDGSSPFFKQAAQFKLARPRLQPLPQRQPAPLQPVVPTVEGKQGPAKALPQKSATEVRMQTKLDSLRRMLKSAEDENKHVRRKLRVTSATINILKKRPVAIDSLYTPIASLPVELQEMIRRELLCLGRTVEYQDVEAFKNKQALTVANGIPLPPELRQQYLPDFIRHNTVDVMTFMVYEPVLWNDSWHYGPISKPDQFPQALHIEITMLDLDDPTDTRTGAVQDCLRILRRFVLAQDLTISFVVRNYDCVNESTCVKTALEDAGWPEMFKALCKLRAVRIQLNLDDQRYWPRTQKQAKMDWLKAAGRIARDAITAVVPSCVVEIEDIKMQNIRKA